MSTLQEYKCPACGGAIHFDSGIQKMKCPYCESEFDMEALRQHDEILNKEQESTMQWEETAGGQWQDGETDDMRTYICNSCAGEIVGDVNMAATSCPYCGNPVVMMNQFSGMLRPDYIIPFQFDKEKAKQALKNHVKGKRLLPKVFKDENHIHEIEGIYVPFWLFDADANADIHYKITRVSITETSDYEYIDTRYFAAHRAGSICFNKVPVDGSSKMADDLMESIEPYDFKKAVDFQTAYLAGYVADKYDVDEKQSVSRANDRIKKSTETVFKNTIKNADTIQVEHSDINLLNSKAKYALYPVWLLNTTWRGQQYTFAMNGQTGKFVGDLPMDKGLYWKYFGIYMSSISVIAFLIMYLIKMI